MRVQRIQTESGSVYDVDHARKRIRRVHGRHGPADTQPQDGIWRAFDALEGPVTGELMVVYWETGEASGARETSLGFRTTEVVEIVDLELDPDPDEVPPERDRG